MNNPLKIICLSGCVIASLLCIKLYSNEPAALEDTPEKPAVSLHETKEKQPAAEKKIEQSKIENNTMQAPQNAEITALKELEGSTRNEYLIRDDILRFIDMNIPQDNPAAYKAAIKLAQYENQVYFHAKNEQEALEAEKKTFLAMRCLSKALGKEFGIFSKKFYEVMDNNSARKKHAHEIEDKYFAFKILGTGLNSFEEDERCQEGKF